MPKSFLEMAKDLVLAQIEAHRLSPEEMPQALQQTHAMLLELQSQEATDGIIALRATETPKTRLPWRKSITKHRVTCLECGASMKQLSIRHLRDHGLDGRSYRIKYGIPRKQALTAKETSARRREITQENRPWEKAPTYKKAQEAKKREKAQATEALGKKTTRRKASNL